MTTNENIIEKENSTITEDMKEYLISYLSPDSNDQLYMKVEQIEKEGGDNYLIFTAPLSPIPTVILKNNQFEEPFKWYYQKILAFTPSPNFKNLRFLLYSHKIEDIPLDPQLIRYVKENYPKIITVQDLTEYKSHQVYNLKDPVFEQIKYILKCFYAIEYSVVLHHQAGRHTDKRKKEPSIISEEMKQEIIDFVSMGNRAKVEQIKEDDDINYAILYTIACPVPRTILFKNNQFAEPFNHYYQELLESTDLERDILKQRIKDFHLDPGIMKYLQEKEPLIITVQDFMVYIRYDDDPYMEHIQDILNCFAAINYSVATRYQAILNTDEKEESLPKLEVEERDRLIAQEFLYNSTISIEELAEPFNQFKLIHSAIDFPTLRKFSKLILKNSQEDKYPNLIMDLDDEKDGIYKQITISTELESTSIEQCRNFKDRYIIYERMEFWNEREMYFTRKLLKTDPSKQNNVIALVYKQWLYNSVEQTLKEAPSLDFTKNFPTKEKEYLEVSPAEQKHYLRCLSRNKDN